MAELYEIVIRNETDGGNSPIATEPNVNGEGNAATPITKKKATAESPNRLVSSIVAVGAIKPYIDQAVSLGVSTVEMRTGSAELQRKKQAFASVASNAGGLIIAGATGGVGAAAAMAGMQLLQTAIQSIINQVNINNQKIIESENLALAKSRAGMVTNKSRGGGVV